MLLAAAVNVQAGQILYRVQRFAPVAYQHAHAGGFYSQPYAVLLANVGKNLRVYIHKAEHFPEELRGFVVLRGLKRVFNLGLGALFLAFAAVAALAAVIPFPARRPYFADFFSYLFAHFAVFAYFFGYGNGFFLRLCRFLAAPGLILAVGAFVAAVTAVAPGPVVAARPVLAAAIGAPFGFVHVVGYYYLLRLALGQLYYGGLCAYTKYALGFVLNYVYLNFVYRNLQLLKAVKNCFVYRFARCFDCPHLSAPSFAGSVLGNFLFSIRLTIIIITLVSVQ